VSEVEFLGALHVELLRRAELGTDGAPHEAFQASTVAALLGGAFDGDVTLAEVLEHGDLGLGTLDGLDGELIVVDGQAFKATIDGELVRPDPATKTPYAVVVPFSPGPPIHVRGPFEMPQLDRHLRHGVQAGGRPTAVRIDARFRSLHVRSVPRQQRPYPTLAEAIAHQRVTELADVTGTMVGFRFPDPLEGIEMAGWHLHFVTEDRARGGHVLSFTLVDGTARLDDADELHVELPPAVQAPEHGAGVDAATLRRLETD
jgi:acetolactate decarboxylase